MLDVHDALSSGLDGSERSSGLPDERVPGEVPLRDDLGRRLLEREGETDPDQDDHDARSNVVVSGDEDSVDNQEDPEDADCEDDEDGADAVQEEPVEEARNSLRGALRGHPTSRRLLRPPTAP